MCLLFVSFVFHWWYIIKRLFPKIEGLGKKIKRGWSYRGLSIEGGQILCLLIGVNDLGANVNTIKNYH